jgi:hypothetical protein
MKCYAFHVRRKNGEIQTELEIHQGDPPSPGTVVDVVLGGETIRAWIGVPRLDPSQRGGDVTIDINAHEID